MAIFGITPKVLAKRVADNIVQQAFDSVITPVNGILQFLNSNFTQTKPNGTLTINDSVNIAGNLTVTGTYPSSASVSSYRYILGTGCTSCNSFKSTTFSGNMYQGSDIHTEVAFVPSFAGSLAAVTAGVYGGGDGVSTPPSVINLNLKKNRGANIIPTIGLTQGASTFQNTYTKGAIAFNAGDLLEVYFDSGGNPCFLINGTGVLLFEVWVYDT